MRVRLGVREGVAVLTTGLALPVGARTAEGVDVGVASEAGSAVGAAVDIPVLLMGRAGVREGAGPEGGIEITARVDVPVASTRSAGCVDASPAAFTSSGGILTPNWLLTSVVSHLAPALPDSTDKPMPQTPSTTANSKSSATIQKTVSLLRCLTGPGDVGAGVRAGASDWSRAGNSGDSSFGSMVETAKGELCLIRR